MDIDTYSTHKSICAEIIAPTPEQLTCLKQANAGLLGWHRWSTNRHVVAVNASLDETVPVWVGGWRGVGGGVGWGGLGGGVRKDGKRQNPKWCEIQHFQHSL